MGRDRCGGGADLSLRHRPQRVDHSQLGFEARGLGQKLHDELHHLGDGNLELSMLLGEDLNVLIHQGPVARLFA